jgi:uncharacterized RDD family membrane protein YckC
VSYLIEEDAGGDALQPDLLGATLSDSVTLASPGRRIVAHVIDSILVLIGILVLLGLGVGVLSSQASSAAQTAIAVAAVGGLLGFYYIRPHATGRQTLGERALGIRLCSDDDLDELIGFRRAVARALSPIVVSPLGAIGLLGWLWILWDKKRQSWFDKIAGTVIIRVR